MTGRWAYLGDNLAGCAAALAAAPADPRAAGASPDAVALLPDRSSQILGTAAAAVLGLPAADFDPGQPAADSLVVAYDLTSTDPDAVAALRERAPGQVLFERATCWTDPPQVTADISGLLGQLSSRRGPRSRRLDDGTVGLGPPTTARPRPSPPRSPAPHPGTDDGDGSAPPDLDEALRRFVQAVTATDARERDGSWLSGSRQYIPDAGPVPSSRFR